MPFIILFIGICVLLSNQPVLMAVALMSYVIIGRLFWREGEPKVLFFGITLFWLSISIKLFYAIYNGVPYESLSNAANIVDTTYSALIAFVVYGTGLYITTQKARRNAVLSFKNDYGYSSRRLLYVYGGSILAMSVVKGSFGLIKGLDQIVFSLIDLKLGFIFVALYAVYVRRDSLPFAIALISVEIILSFFSFFSGFKDILFAMLIVLMAPKIKLGFKSIVSYSIVAFAALYLLFSWQFIKGEYRAFLNKGTNSQSVEVSQGEALDKLQELAMADKKEEEKEKIVYTSIDRLSYIEFYSESRMKVPAFMPYENGKIWAGNLAHIFLPRMFFPDKEAIDDSKMVNKYCFRKVLTAKSGVSMSLGFVAESYIDFGPVFMYVIIFLVGCFMGIIYSAILRQSINLFWGYTMVLPLFIKINCNGTPGTKILGWMITYYVAFWLFKRFLMGRLETYLKTGVFK